MSNFDFLQKQWPRVFEDAVEAERLAVVSPKASAILCRSALENGVNWLYDNDSDLSRGYDERLSALIHRQCFQDILQPAMFREINVIRMVGNNGAHGSGVRRNEAVVSVKNLFRFGAFLALIYGEPAPVVPPFEDSLIPDGKEAEKSRKELKKLEQALRERNDEARKVQALLEEQAAEIEELRKEIEANKLALAERKEARFKSVDIQQAVPLLLSEKETRRLYIDLSLKESGWDDLRKGRELEYEVTGMPKSTNPSGKGYADYVLWGDDGLPLAVIEAKKAMESARKGRHQAELYADCLEKAFGRRPLIFYTNGFETFLWDDLFYTDRRVSGFYTRDELQLAIDRRASRLDLRTFKVNPAITDRPYQLEAVRRVAEAFVTGSKKKGLKGTARAALLVMATGSGKTRTAASIVDMLTKCNWVKRVLFLADRNALVSQAKNAFNEHLPHLSAIDLTKEKEDKGTRLVFSTYPTIMNKIDDNRSDEIRFYGPGHFDLVIIDEAHRSVYQKYGAIFEYFDSLLIGLTATPKGEVDRNTYFLFGLEDEIPTFAYELDQAVAHKYLVPPKGIHVPIKFQRQGIKYDQLSEEEQAEYEEKFGDFTREEEDKDIPSSALNQWLFNADTVDRVLDFLMTGGLKVEGGDRLGKTIIFAKNHKHALFIEERFNKNYPEYSGKFLRVIDNYEPKAQDLLETFSDKYVEEEPHIAVSVDMMDTGVDAPRVVNLVFFKLVKSLTKFLQMVGRGTRLCPGLFGPEEDKEHFLIFDFCGNFEFFDRHPEGLKGGVSRSLTQLVFLAKLEAALLLRQKSDPSEEEQALAEDIVKGLHKTISGLDQSRFVVKRELKKVLEYSSRSRWENLTKVDLAEISSYLAPLLLPAKGDNELARRFDLLLINYQLALLTGSYSTEGYKNRITYIARALVKKKNIPAVNHQGELLEQLQSDPYWQSVTVIRLEEVRKALRGLIKFLDKEERKSVYTDFEDEIHVDEIMIRDDLPIYGDLRSYRERVESYIREHKDHIAIHKLNTNVPITTKELEELERLLFNEEQIGTREDFKKEYGDTPLGKFIRGIVGLDIKSANAAFAEFLQAENLRADQITFLNGIITHLTKNGTIDKAMLFEPPFTNINDQGLFGVFDDEEAGRIIEIVEKVNGNAGVA